MTVVRYGMRLQLWPLLGMVGLGCVLATVYSAYSLVQKPDVRYCTLDLQELIEPVFFEPSSELPPRKGMRAYPALAWSSGDAEKLHCCMLLR